MTHLDDLATLDRLLADKNMTLEEAEAVGRVKAAAERWRKMPRTEDGVTVGPGDRVFPLFPCLDESPKEDFITLTIGGYDCNGDTFTEGDDMTISMCFSTFEAATAARQAPSPDGGG